MVYVAVAFGLAVLAGLLLLVYALCVAAARADEMDEWTQRFMPEEEGSDDDDEVR